MPAFIIDLCRQKTGCPLFSAKDTISLAAKYIVMLDPGAKYKSAIAA
jgi:hypothetical protein